MHVYTCIKKKKGIVKTGERNSPAAGLPMSRGARAVTDILLERSCKKSKKNNIKNSM